MDTARIKRLFVRVVAGIGATVVLLITAVIVKFYVLSPKSRPAPVMAALSLNAPASRTASRSAVGACSKIEDRAPANV